MRHHVSSKVRFWHDFLYLENYAPSDTIISHHSYLFFVEVCEQLIVAMVGGLDG